MKLRQIVLALFSILLIGLVGVASFVYYLHSTLPKLVTAEDYKPLIVSEVYGSKVEKIGEFFREKRIITTYDKIPKKLVEAFVAAEDDQFFNHGGINYLAIMRAAIANIKAGRKVQGGSTITQQVARSLMLTPEKNYIRKIREILLSYKMESNLSKEEIIYLYLNQIYLGEGAYGVAAASQVYFRKPLDKMLLEEMALLAGLPQAPSRYSPLDNPSSAKARQRYVLGRMQEVGFITSEEYKKAIEAPVNVYARQSYKEMAPFYVETIRQYLVKAIGESKVLDEGIKVYTGLDSEKQKVAQEQVMIGLRDLDKRQGYRGPLNNLSEATQVGELLLKTRNKLIDESQPLRTINPDGTMTNLGPLDLTPKKYEGGKNLPPYLKLNQIVEGVVTDVNDKWGLVTVRVAEAQGLIDYETMKWARKPNPEIRMEYDELKKPSLALKNGDVILVKVAADKFHSPRIAEKLIDLKKAFARSNKNKKFENPADLPIFDNFIQLQLEQEPIAEGALLSYDLKSEDILAMVGGYDFTRSEFNRSLQAIRQTGSSFKPIVFAAALDNGYTPATMIIDAPIVYEEKLPPEEGMQNSEGDTKIWKPGNYGKSFSGDILFRNALISSLNIPTIKILEDVGVKVVADYSRRLGLFSPLNEDLSLGLGSSSVTLYEMTKVFSHFARLGKRIRPQLIRSVVDAQGQTLVENVSLDMRFESEIAAVEKVFEEKRLAMFSSSDSPEANEATQAETENQDQNPEAPKPKKKEAHIYFKDPDQLMSPQTAYLMTTLLKGAIFDPGATGAAARALGRPAAGKTGTTSSYYDTWFIGYTPQILTGVWVGNDKESSLGVGETGGRTSLPIWLEYMKIAHESLPRLDFSAPDKIVFANIDNQTGKLASASTEVVVRQAFIEGTEPGQTTGESVTSDEEKDFFRQDLSE